MAGDSLIITPVSDEEYRKWLEFLTSKKIPYQRLENGAFQCSQEGIYFKFRLDGSGKDISKIYVESNNKEELEKTLNSLFKLLKEHYKNEEPLKLVIKLDNKKTYEEADQREEFYKQIAQKHGIELSFGGKDLTQGMKSTKPPAQKQEDNLNKNTPKADPDLSISGPSGP